ncbi:MAG: tetratricopeptide repeat protein [Nitrospirales bacterium]|nr:tetratricopeptide repeat protein [Nitrospirales bacterium]
MIQSLNTDKWNIRHFQRWIRCVLLLVIMSGCVGTSPPSADEPLPPPEHANNLAAPLIMEGNRLFMQKMFRDAEMKYQEAIEIQSSLGEAHYNLGLALTKRKLYSDARPHFEKAAELEPFNPIIRNAPPFRRYEPPAPNIPEPIHDSHMGHQH